MSKHTPGPWINDGDTVSARPDPENSETYIAPICTMDTDWSPEIMAANASLIAAAPELLEALNEWMTVYGDEEYKDCPEVVRTRAAIAKAEGTA